MWRMGRRAISDGKETQSLTLSASPERPQPSSDLFSVYARVARGGEGNSHSRYLICRIYREIMYFRHFEIKSGSCKLMF